MRYAITAPLKGFTGQSVGIAFQGGTAEVSDDNDSGRSALAYFRRAGYRVEEVNEEVLVPVDDDQDDDGEPYDPTAHKADEVLDHLGAASYEEAVRVLDAEAASAKARVTITSRREEILASKTPTTPATADDEQKGPQA